MIPPTPGSRASCLAVRVVEASALAEKCPSCGRVNRARKSWPKSSIDAESRAGGRPPSISVPGVVGGDRLVSQRRPRNAAPVGIDADGGRVHLAFITSCRDLDEGIPSR
jgi:hypothetical protein